MVKFSLDWLWTGIRISELLQKLADLMCMIKR